MHTLEFSISIIIFYSYTWWSGSSMKTRMHALLHLSTGDIIITVGLYLLTFWCHLLISYFNSGNNDFQFFFSFNEYRCFLIFPAYIFTFVVAIVALRLFYQSTVRWSGYVGYIIKIFFIFKIRVGHSQFNFNYSIWKSNKLGRHEMKFKKNVLSLM